MFLHLFPLFGIIGTAVVISGIGISALLYQGRQGERFSLLNHFISELGEVGVSRAAVLFNIGLTVGGLTLLPYMIGMGILFGSLIGWLGSITGMVAALGVAAVGLFPMNNLTTHGRAAMTYFRAGLIMVLFFALAIMYQPAGHNKLIPQAANLLSLFSFAAYASFLALLTGKKRRRDTSDSLDPQKVPERPRVWLLPILEWIVFFTTILWLFGMALFI